MSSIASFYLLRTEHVSTVKELARQPVEPVFRKVLWFKVNTGKWHDPYRQFLRREARELDRLSWSGSVMAAVEMFLRSASIDMFAFADRAITDYLSKARGSLVIGFRQTGAHQLVEAISGLRLTREALDRFVQAENDLPDDTPVDGIMDAVAILEKWLLKVDDVHVGLLTIG